MTSPQKQQSTDQELHAHSPRRRTVSSDLIRDKLSAVMLPPIGLHPSLAPHQPPGTSFSMAAPRWPGTMPDPFIESDRLWLNNRRSGNNSLEDQLMPDYSRSITPASSHHSNNEFTIHSRRPSGMASNDHHSWDEFLRNPPPQDHVASGTFAPANTRVSSAANTPPIQTRPSAAAEARVASYTQVHSRAVSVGSKDQQQGNTRQNSDISMKSRFSEDQVASKDQSENKVLTKISGDVKSKKEGKTPEPGTANNQLRKVSSKASITGSDKENSKVTVTAIAASVTLSDGKRKRANTNPGAKTVYNRPDEFDSSPTRKVLKKEYDEIAPAMCTDELTPDDHLAREALQALDNVQ